MSEIRFISEQGDLLEAAITEASVRQPTTPMTRIRQLVRPHKRLAAVIVALALAGCAAVAATSLGSPTQRLLFGRVDCYYGTTLKAAGAVFGGSEALISGETPQASCRAFKWYKPAGSRQSSVGQAPDPQLIACRQNATTIAVFIASGKADQCQHLGLAPLPRTYNSASKAILSLGAALKSLYFSRNCWSAAAFASAVHTILIRQGFANWRILAPNPKAQASGSPAGTGGRCAVFVLPDPYIGNPYLSLNGPKRSFSFALGMSLSDHELSQRLTNTLTAATWRRCYSPSEAAALTARVFAGTGLTPRLAVTTRIHRGRVFPLTPGSPPQVADKEHHFQLGCVIQPEIWIASNDRFADVWLKALHGQPIRFGTYPPPMSYFHSS
jgi:hypothetical protein